MSKLFMKSTPPPTEYTEEQTTHNIESTICAGFRTRWGQRLTIPNRKLTKLAFLIRKIGNPPGGPAYFEIRRVSDDSLIASESIGYPINLPTSLTWIEVDLTDQPIINEEVRVYCRYEGGNQANSIGYARQNTDVKAGEWSTDYLFVWGEAPTYDSTYRYKYYEV